MFVSGGIKTASDGQRPSTLSLKRVEREAERGSAALALSQVDAKIAADLSPNLEETKALLDALIERRVGMESLKSDREQADGLQLLRVQLERELKQSEPDPKGMGGP
jgi:hypothetical protein